MEQQNSKPLFSTYNQYEPVLSNMRTDVAIPVIKGAQNITAVVQQASSASANNITWSYLPPSNTVVSPVIYWKQKFQVTCTSDDTLPAANKVLEFGSNTCFSKFPQMMMIDSSTVSIDNASIAEETGQIFPIISQLFDEKSVKDWNTMTPTSDDVYYNYSDAAPYSDVFQPYGGSSNSRSSYVSSFDGTFNLGANPNGTLVNAVPAVVAVNQGPNGIPAAVQPVNAVAAVAGTAKSTVLTCTLTTPLLIAPFSMKSDCESGGFSVNSKMTINLKLKSVHNFLRSKLWGLTLSQFTILNTDSELLMFIYTPSISRPIDNRQVHEYYSYTRSQVNITPSNTPVTSPSLNLGITPEKMIVAARRIVGDDTLCKDSDYFLTQKQLSITYDNQSSLLADATPLQLFNMSVEAGLKNTDAQKWSGKFLNSDGTYTPSVGGPIVLDFSRHIQNKDLVVPNMVQTVNAYVKSTLSPQVANVAGAQYELVVLYMYKSLLVSQNGTSLNFNSGLLTQSDVLASLNAPVQPWQNNKHIYGGYGKNWMEKENHKNRLEQRLKMIEDKVEASGRASGRASGDVSQTDLSNALLQKIRKANK